VQICLNLKISASALCLALYLIVPAVFANNISQQTLNKHHQEYLIIDVRSKLEFDVLHIAGAYHVPMSNQGFEIRVKQLCSNQCKIVTDCNGDTCKKSVQAAEHLRKADMQQVFAYTGGIFSWARIYPEKTVLLNNQPAKLANLLPEEKYREHLLQVEGFFNKALESNSVIVDVRDNLQREANSLA